VPGEPKINAKIIEDDGRPRVLRNNKLETEQIDTILDSDWFNSVMLSRGTDLETESDKIYRYWSSVRYKWTDSSPGGNIGINPRPQFTPYADVREKGLKPNRSDVSPSSKDGDTGQGRYYSEAIDDHDNIIYMRYGLSKFAGLFNFLSRAIDHNVAKLANTGRTSTARSIGEVVGTVLSISAFPVANAFYYLGRLIGKGAGAVIPISSSKFYTMKPTMYMYWSAVTSLINDLSVDLGLSPLSPPTGNDTSPYVDGDKMGLLREAFPEIVKDDNFIDVFAIATRSQRIANSKLKKEVDAVYDNPDMDYNILLKEMEANIANVPDKSFTEFATAQLHTSDSKLEITNADNGEIDVTSDKDRLSKPADPEEEKSWYDSILSYVYEMSDVYKSAWKDGAQYAIFRVDHVETVSESFSNNVEESGLKSVINSKSSGARSMHYAIAGGNVADGVIADAVGTALTGIKDFAAGILDRLTFGVSNILTALAGGGYIDVPKQWSDSSVTLPSITYSTKLISPYGNPVSQLINIYIPLTMLLAGVLPLATGKSSYTSPFLCNIEHPGRQSIPLGMITSLSITRGTSNLGFNEDNRAMAIDVSFTVTDLSSIMYMPISTGSLFGVDMGLDEDHILSRYLMSLSGRDVNSRHYFKPRMKIRAAKLAYRKDQFTSPGSLALWFNDTIPGRLLSIFSPQNDLLK